MLTRLSNFLTGGTRTATLWLLILGLAFLPCLLAGAAAPTVTRVQFSNSPPDGQHNFYTVDDDIEVEVTFSETVTVGGKPQLTLIFEDSLVSDEGYATFDEGSGTSTLTFTYKVAEGERDHDGVEIKANSLKLNGGRIRNAADEEANLAHDSVGEDSSRKVDTLVTYIVLGEEYVPASPILFNEIGNASRTAHDWIELRNTTNKARSVDEWELSIITEDQDDESIITFPNEDIPANGTLLIVSRDPGSTPLAAGIEFGTNDGYGAGHLYLVAEELELPNDGRFMLILRDDDRDTGTLRSLVDIAGNHFADTSNVPLDSGTVWVRDERRDGYEKNAWEEAEYTGLGYDRGADESLTNGGTPGYDNEAIKDRISDFDSQAQITISEIMLATGRGRVPQWVELYNNSLTDAVNLNGWHLEIENYSSEDSLVSRYAKITIQDDLYVLPNQTVLIVSNSTRTAESDAFPSGARVYNLYNEHRDDLGVDSRWDPVLSQKGFYLALTDRRSPNKPLDEIGNLDGKRQTKDEPAWELPTMLTEDGARASLIRRYGDAKNGGRAEARDGKKRNAWISAASVNKLSGDTYYGDTTDLGNPGYREGGPLPVQLAGFQVSHTDAGVVIKWTTESELNNAGFNILRREAKEGEFKPLNATLITGAGTTGERNTYQFVDTTTKPGIVYYYRLEDVSFAGERQTLATHRPRGQLSAASKLTTTWSSLKHQD